MVDSSFIREAFQAPEGHVDTAEQAQLRQCLISVIDGHDTIRTIQICREIIDLMRDQLMGSAAMVRRHAARTARDDGGLQLMEIASQTGLTKATVNRLLTESR